MKYFLSILAIIISVSSFGQDGKLTIKSSGAPYYPANNYVRTFSIISYGATANTGTDQTSYIQAAINACHGGGGGGVYAPTGEYNTAKLISYSDVTIFGDGRLSTIFKSNTADTMIVVDNLTPALAGVYQNDQTNDLIKDIRLKGHGQGTIGLYVNRIANFYISRVMIDSFTVVGMYLQNSLIGTVQNCYMRFNRTGVKGYSDYSNNTAVTLVKFDACSMDAASKYGIDWQGGGMLNLDHCDLSGCGTVNDTTTGCVYYHGNIWPGGLSMKDCWDEQSYGIEINISGNVTPITNSYPGITSHSIEHCQFLGHQYSFTTRNISITGHNQRLTVSGESSFSGAATSIVATGANNVVTIFGSTFTTGTTPSPGVFTERSGAVILYNHVVTSAASTLTLSYGTPYVFTGSTAIYTLPAISSNYFGNAFAITIKNRGSGNITVNSAASNGLYISAVASTQTVLPGESFTYLPDGTYFNVQ